MREAEKIEQAEYYLQRIVEVADDPRITRFEISSFLAAARSVLMYAYKEVYACKTQAPERLAWYEATISGSPVVGYFKDERDGDIHHQPFSMRTHGTIHTATGSATFSSTGPTVNINGDTITWPDLPALFPPRSPNMTVVPPPTTTYRYEFKSWTGPEDVLELCGKYLDEIKRIVGDGQARGFLTP